MLERLCGAGVGGGCPLRPWSCGFDDGPSLSLGNLSKSMSVPKRGTVWHTVPIRLNREDEWHVKSGFGFYAKPVLLKTADGF